MADVNQVEDGCGAATGNRKVSAPRAISRTNTPNPRDCVKLQAQTAAPFFNKPLKSQDSSALHKTLYSYLPSHFFIPDKPLRGLCVEKPILHALPISTSISPGSAGGRGRTPLPNISQDCRGGCLLPSARCRNLGCREEAKMVCKRKGDGQPTKDDRRRTRTTPYSAAAQPKEN